MEDSEISQENKETVDVRQIFLSKINHVKATELSSVAWLEGKEKLIYCDKLKLLRLKTRKRWCV